MYFNNGINMNYNLRMYQNVRDYMVTNIYMRQDVIDELQKLITDKIDVIQINYDTMRLQFYLEIKKSTMRRAKGYSANVMYYYGVMKNVYKEFFQNHPQIVWAIQQFVQGAEGGDLDMIASNLCQVRCIGDKFVEILL